MNKKKPARQPINFGKKAKKLETKVTKLLDQAKIKYKTLQHRVVFTAHDVGATTKKKLGEIAKVVLVRVDGAPREDGLLLRRPSFPYFVLIVLPAGKYVDFSGIKKALKAKKVSMASEKDIAKYLKTKVGLLHPFGSEYNLQTLLDKGMAKSKKMIASAGTFTDSVEVGLKDFQKLVKPVLGNFSKKKK